MLARVSTAIAAIAVLAVVTMGAASAQEVKKIGAFKDWTAYQAGQVCYMASTPKTDEGDYTARGAIYAMVSHRPATQSFNEVSIQAGYAYKKGSTAEVSIGKKKFTLFTHEEAAWAHDAADDKALVRAMRAGEAMVVLGTSWRGTKTKDSYSLFGFTAAHNAIGKACKAP